MKAPVKHLGIIMDGNRRWATRRGLPSTLGHRAGVAAARKVVEAARRFEIPFVTLYAFSSDNWRRTPAEVNAIFGVLDGYLTNEVDLLAEQGIRTQVIGRRDRLPPRTQRLIDIAQARTASGGAMLLRLAVDYSSRDAIVAAARSLAGTAVATSTGNRETFFEHLCSVTGSCVVPDIDLVIRTSGEQRLSDFCLWECSYAELYFTDTLWPDFSETTLEQAFHDYASRQRRFGGSRSAETCPLETP